MPDVMDSGSQRHLQPGVDGSVGDVDVAALGGVKAAGSFSVFSHDPIRVLVAWSPQQGGDEALAVAAWLSRVADVRVRCACAFVRPWTAPGVAKSGGKYVKWFAKEQKRYREAVVSGLSDCGVAEAMWDGDVAVFLDGNSESVLLTQAAQDFGADVVVLGSQATAPKGRFLPGTTADAMLHSSPVPLVLAPRAPKLSKRGVTRVNFVLMGEEQELSALLRAAQIACEWGVPLRIVALSPGGFGPPPVSDALDLPADVRHEWRENTLAALDRARDEVYGVFGECTVGCEIGSGSGWSAALDALKWKKGDLLCFASSPLGPLARVFIGSQTSSILRHARVPVLMIPGHSF
ncbi:universal stress protein [Corynebacterium felinum]|uniref:Nucleotide-binding universal stress UspA family protein n=1 Tax=Corynebacterium felinum TaxID=131318 RepID=A0ABU2B6C6_9CORY|nr:universal stress protein [Corynebacterium felinum]MDR7354174.1 nucleotide-binding universal stress UspA family protein [Corynebacterium felinum]